MPSFDYQIHNTEFVINKKTFHTAILRINNKTLGQRK